MNTKTKIYSGRRFPSASRATWYRFVLVTKYLLFGQGRSFEKYFDSY
jgi:hypothetical protein